MKSFFYSLSFLFFTISSFGQILNNISIWKDFDFTEQRLPHFEWNSDSSVTFYGRNTVTLSTKSGDTMSVETKNPNTITKNGLELIPTNKKHIYRHSFDADYLIINNNDTSSLHQSSQQAVAFSPNGQYISFVSDNNLFVYNIESKGYEQVTQNGKKNHIINGVSDWVHEEEFGFTKGYWWSDDAQYIAYLAFDETEVPTYTLTKQSNGNYPELIEYKYPKVGEKNAIVTLNIYDVTNNTNSTICSNAESEYILTPTWHKGKLYFETLDRKQQTLNIITYQNNTFDTIYSETSSTYINHTPIFFHGNNIILQSEKTGFNQIYSLNLINKELNIVTPPSHIVTEVIDIHGEFIYYKYKKGNSTDNLMVRYHIANETLEPIGGQFGDNSLYISPKGNSFIIKHSTILTPPTYTLLDKHLKPTKTLLDNKFLTKKIQQNNIQQPQIDSIVTEVGIFNTYTIYPPKFKKWKKYPTLVYVYGGPGYQTVENKWLGTMYAWHQYIASKGYIVISIDPRGTGGKGAAFRNCTYGDLGTKESEDIISAVQAFSKQRYVDEKRIGIWGWSFGGYLTTRCILTEKSPFKMGIAVAPVTDWRFYDNIYTERYMGLNDSTNTGYNSTSCLNTTDNLEANFLLVHGTLDDNVHIQNTYMLQEKLIESNKDFDSFVYPNKNHGIYGGNTRVHLFNKITDYILKNL